MKTLLRNLVWKGYLIENEFVNLFVFRLDTDDKNRFVEFLEEV